MNQTINANRLFWASCFALITTAFSFSIRAGILTQLGAELSLDPLQLGTINSMWFLGFPISMIFFGIFYAKIGPRIIMQVAFLTHAIGILTTIYASSYNVLLISTLFIGIGNGCTEAACNPMIADSYSGNEFHSKLNKFHMWFPGGIVLGSLISKFMTDAAFHWQAQIWIILIPTVIYAIMFWGQSFPQPKADASSPLASFKAMLNPLYLFMAACMALTAISEFGPQQWVGPILSKAGASPMLILALVTGLMAVGRFFAGPLVEKLNTAGVLLGSAVFGLIGIYMLSTMSGNMLYVAAVFYALGICYFWPNMLGYVGQHLPQTGALGLSIIGGIGMFSSSIFQPIIGGWIKDNKATALATGLVGDAADLAAGQATLSKMLLFPAILIVAFIILYFFGKNLNRTLNLGERNKFISLPLILIFGIILAASNPTEDQHRSAVLEKITEKINQSSELNSDNEWSRLVKQMGLKFLESTINSIVTRNNFYLFSITKVAIKDNEKQIGIGFLGNVWIYEDYDKDLNSNP